MLPVSIIIPVYNSQQYLRRTLDCVLSQSYKDWECILVDDGSVDNSGMICDEYAEQDSRFRVIHKENGGVSSARNAGLGIAVGKWINFIDSDDIITPDALCYMINKAEGYDADVCICKLMGSQPDTDETFEITQTERNQLVWSCLAFRTSEYSDRGYSVDGPVAKLFRSSIIKEHNLQYVVGLSRSEDAIFDSYFYQFSKTIIFSNHTVYSYEYNTESLTHAYNKNLPETLSKVLLEEEKFGKSFLGEGYLEAVYVRAFVGMLQIIEEGAKHLSFIQHYKYFKYYLTDYIVQSCIKQLSYDLVKTHFEGRFQVVKLFLAKKKQALAILLWIKIRHH